MNYIKTYLIACALMGSSLFIYGADLTPEERARIEEDQMQEIMEQSRILEESRRLAAQPKPTKELTTEEEQLALALSASQAEADEKARQKKTASTISPQEQLQIDWALACSGSEADERRLQERIMQQIRERNEHDKKEREHKDTDAKSRRAQEERDRSVALQAQEQFDRETAREMIERERKRHQEKASQAAIARLQQEDEDHQAAQQLAAQEAENHKREQERKAEEDKKQREAAERKREAENPIASFNTITYQVHPQTGASCGLHAIDNANKAYTCLIRNESPTEILKQPLSAAVADIPLAQRDMLDAHQIRTIARVKLHMDQAHVTIIPNLMQSKDEFLQAFPHHETETTYLPDTLGTAVQALRTQERATEVFVFANAKIERNDKGELVGHDDHWIGIVADKKDGIVTFHYMDTGGGPNTNFTKALEDIIARGNYHGMQLAIILENVKLSAIAHAINDSAYRTALNALKERVDLAHKAGVINDARFPKQDITQLLRHIEFAAGDPYAAQAQELLNKLR